MFFVTAPIGWIVTGNVAEEELVESAVEAVVPDPVRRGPPAGGREPQLRAAHPGDQRVPVRIVLPETVDEGLSYFLSEWRQKHKYDPGRP